jgi:hypothetical protein
MSEWQPIETAPKDGARVLLGRFAPRMDRHGYCAVDWYRQAKDGNGFIGFGKFNMTFWPPTHWMPLPAPPTE